MPFSLAKSARERRGEDAARRRRGHWPGLGALRRRRRGEPAADGAAASATPRPQAVGPSCAAGARTTAWAAARLVAPPAHRPFSPSASRTAIGVLTLTFSVPSATRIWPTVPSSTASTSIVALSVSISAMTLPALDDVALPSPATWRACPPPWSATARASGSGSAWSFHGSLCRWSVLTSPRASDRKTSGRPGRDRRAPQPSSRCTTPSCCCDAAVCGHAGPSGTGSRSRPDISMMRVRTASRQPANNPSWMRWMLTAEPPRNDEAESTAAANASSRSAIGDAMDGHSERVDDVAGDHREEHREHGHHALDRSSIIAAA